MTTFIMCYTASAAGAPISELTQLDKTEKVTITWAVNPAPPFHIFEGKYASQGIGDVMLNSIIAQLPEAEHTIVRMPHSRISKSVDADINLCFPCLIKRSRSSKWVYSKANVEYLPLGVIAHPDTIAPFLDSNGRVSFKQLIENSQLTFAKPVARKYPDVVQTIVENAKGNPRFETIAGADSATRVLNQLEYGRIDFTLEYPAILTYLTRTEGKSKLQYYYTTELGETPIPGAVGCTNNAWGENVIEHVNEALKSIVDTPDYRASQGFWLSP
jgi:uncharacterized protein (TIGR02285 family)